MYVASIYFHGRFRPAYFQAETVSAAIEAARVASCGMQQAAKVKAWLDAAERDMKRDGYAGVSASHGMLGISVRSGPHDPFLDRAIASLPECPGLAYPT